MRLPNPLRDHRSRVARRKEAARAQALRGLSDHLARDIGIAPGGPAHDVWRAARMHLL